VDAAFAILMAISPRLLIKTRLSNATSTSFCFGLFDNHFWGIVVKVLQGKEYSAISPCESSKRNHNPASGETALGWITVHGFSGIWVEK
jgi:hypothetical protein